MNYLLSSVRLFVAGALIHGIPSAAAVLTFNFQPDAASGNYFEYTGIPDGGSTLSQTFGGFAMAGQFALDTTQGQQTGSGPGFSYQQNGLTPFVTSTVTTGVPTPGLLNSINGLDGYYSLGSNFQLTTQSITTHNEFDEFGNIVRSFFARDYHAVEVDGATGEQTIDGVRIPTDFSFVTRLFLQSLYVVTIYDYTPGGVTETTNSIRAELVQFYNPGSGNRAQITLSGLDMDIPEPTSLALLGIGLLGIGALRRRATA